MFVITGRLIQEEYSHIPQEAAEGVRAGKMVLWELVNEEAGPILPKGALVPLPF